MTEKLTHEDILERLAPCGLDCHRCVMCGEGIVRRSAEELRAALEGFGSVAAGMTDRVSSLAGYRQFEDVLGFLATADCTGCRAGGSALPFCAARVCFREQGADYCFQCPEYPCRRNDYPGPLERRWRESNDRMGEIGVEAFYEESLRKPRYR